MRRPINLVADAVRETYNVDVEFENSGGVRAPLVGGDITRADLVTMDPFGNTVVLFKATGAQIKDILARHAPYVSGVRYRLVDGKLEEATIGGKADRGRPDLHRRHELLLRGVRAARDRPGGHGPAAAGRRDRLRAGEGHGDAGLRRAARDHRPPGPGRGMTAKSAAARAAMRQRAPVEAGGRHEHERGGDGAHGSPGDIGGIERRCRAARVALPQPRGGAKADSHRHPGERGQRRSCRRALTSPETRPWRPMRRARRQASPAGW